VRRRKERGRRRSTAADRIELRLELGLRLVRLVVGLRLELRRLG
jgi:hypothetical protein